MPVVWKKTTNLCAGVTDSGSSSRQSSVGGDLDVHGNRDPVAEVSRARRGNDSVHVCSQRSK